MNKQLITISVIYVQLENPPYSCNSRYLPTLPFTKILITNADLYVVDADLSRNFLYFILLSIPENSTKKNTDLMNGCKLWKTESEKTMEI